MLTKQLSAKGSKGEREWKRGCMVIDVCKQVHIWRGERGEREREGWIKSARTEAGPAQKHKAPTHLGNNEG